MDGFPLPWVHLVGLYLLIGTLTSGLGLLARLRWHGYQGEFFPKNERGRIFFGIGILIGVFLWPLVLLLIPVFRRLMRRRANRILGHCEHATPFTPFCEACGREQKKGNPRFPPGYISPDSAREAKKRLAEIQRRIDERVKAGILFPPQPRAPGIPPAPASPDAAAPESPAYYICAICHHPWPGFPAVVTVERRPLCEACSKKSS
jgi:hypothetical protein